MRNKHRNKELKKVKRIKNVLNQKLRTLISRLRLSALGLQTSDYKPSHRIIALFFTIIFLQTLIPYNQLWANNNGPTAPEAAAFEPVDATDMVNLVTGDFSYVLPLLNVPSPEGGYPLALSYHAGIAMDQEASWVGLGWSLNPGAINRSVNGYADDLIKSPISEYFYDEGGQESIYSISLGYSIGVSVGVGFSWGSNRASSGYISMGAGVPVGEGSIGINYSGGSSNSSLNIGYRSASGLSFGASVSRSGKISGNASYSYAPANNNGTGFSIGASTNGTYSASISERSNTKNNSIGLNFSSSSANISVNGLGIGLNLASNSAIQAEDYNQKQSGYNIPIIIPTPIGIFSFGFGKQKIRYGLSKNKYSTVSGPTYLYENINNSEGYKIKCYQRHGCGSGPCGGVETTFDGVVNSVAQKDKIIAELANCESCYCEDEIVPIKSFMDIYEMNLFNAKPIRVYNIELELNKMIFPAYDKYNVQAQGLSGSISAKYYEKGGLFGLSDLENNNLINHEYVNHADPTLPNSDFRFTKKPSFHFDSEISNYIDVGHSNAVSNANHIDNNFDSTTPILENRLRKSSYIEHFTNSEIVDQYNMVKSKGYLKPFASGFSRNKFPKTGIGAFKITSVDGKTYHYSLPVYNHEIITRTFGGIKERPNQHQAYIEKRQLEPYATHWLLTAITGPDFIDNGDGSVGSDDKGYWVGFNYGKWSDAFVWKNPYDSEYIEHYGSNSKTSIRGRKQVYYLNSVNTRTHSALFIKSIRNDAKSIPWKYESVTHEDNLIQDSNSYTEKFTIPSQRQLKLDRIVLLKNEDAKNITTIGNSSQTSDYMSIKYNQSDKENEIASYNSYENVYNQSNINDNLLQKALKVIDFTYASGDQSLVKNSPNTDRSGTGRLTLDQVSFRGRENKSVIPPYTFDYQFRTRYYSTDQEGPLGYHHSKPSQWSLNKIKTPQGATIDIEYEKHKAIPSVNHELVFSNKNAEFFMAEAPDFTNINDVSNKKINIYPGKNIVLPIKIGDKVHIEYGTQKRDGATYPCLNNNFINAKYDGSGTVTNIKSESYEITFDSDIDLVSINHRCTSDLIESYFDGTYTGRNITARSRSRQEWEYIYRPIDVIFDTTDKVFEIDHSRVKSITVNDNFSQIKNEYTYGKNDDGIGTISYLPYAPKLSDEIPFSLELPPAQVMYEYTSIKPNSIEGSKERIQYKFQVLPKKTISVSGDACSFGKLFEIKKKILYAVPLNDQLHESSHEFDINDRLNQLGRLLETSSFNAKGQLVNKTINSYLTDEDLLNQNIGITTESYVSYKTVDYNRTNVLNDYFFNSSRRIKHPNILKSITQIFGGHTYKTYFNNFDINSGQSLEKITSNHKNDSLKTKIIPAYKINEYTDNSIGYSMGSKVDNPTNKNMLTQTAANLTQIKGSNGDWKTINADITTWNNNWTYYNQNGTTTTPANASEKIWRKHKTFAWKGQVDDDGAYIGYTGALDDFDWNDTDGTQANTKWINTSTVSLYDHYSMPLEAIDINGNKASTKMTDDQSKIIAVSNAGYQEMFYSGAEYRDGNYLEDQMLGGQYQKSDVAHTGTQSLLLDSGNQGFKITLPSGKHREGKYKTSVWVRKSDLGKIRINIKGTTKTFNGERADAGDWTQLNHYEDLGSGNETVYITAAGGSIYVDDFRICPIESSMTSYVYNQWDELSYIIGANNLATHYIYDDAGRLIETQSEVIDNETTDGGFKKTQRTIYNYK